MTLLYKHFYQTAEGLLGLVLTNNLFGTERQNFAVRYEDGYLSENYANLAYSWLDTNDVAEIKKRTLLHGPVDTEIVYIDNVKYVSFPTLNRKLNYGEICSQYAKPAYDRDKLIQFCPHGYEYNYFISLKSDLVERDDFEFVYWLYDNFSIEDFHISEYYQMERFYNDEQDEEPLKGNRYRPQQVGHAIHFKNQEQVNLTKLTWKDLVLVDLRENN